MCWCYLWKDGGKLKKKDPTQQGSAAGRKDHPVDTTPADRCMVLDERVGNRRCHAGTGDGDEIETRKSNVTKLERDELGIKGHPSLHRLLQWRIWRTHTRDKIKGHLCRRTNSEKKIPAGEKRGTVLAVAKDDVTDDTDHCGTDEEVSSAKDVGESAKRSQKDCLRSIVYKGNSGIP